MNTPDYASAASCPHPESALRQLANGEIACDACVHVAKDRAGVKPKYSAPVYRWETAHRTDAELLHDLTRNPGEPPE